MRLRLAIALVGAAAIALACEQDRPTPSSTAAAPGPTPAASGEPAPSGGLGFEELQSPPPMPFPGLYVNEYLSFSGDATSVVIRSASDCTSLQHIVEAGEWRVVGGSTTGPQEGGALPLTILALERDGDAGPESALAWLAGGDTCFARVVRTLTGSISVSGAATFNGEAPYNEFLCVSQGTAIGFGVTYRPPNGPAVQISLLAPARLGQSALDTDTATVHIGRGEFTIAKLAASIVDGFKEPDRGNLPEAYEAGNFGRATIDVTSISPFEGIVTISDYQGPKGTIDLEAHVSCHRPGSALQRAAEALAGPSGTIAPATPGPTLGNVGEADPGTAVVTGGPLAGTYQMPADELYCVRDEETGDWVATSVAQTSFFVLARAPAGGGETDTAQIGMVSGDGSIEANIDTTLTPPEGAAHVTVTVSGSTVSFVLTGRTPEGWSIAANLSCSRSE